MSIIMFDDIELSSENDKAFFCNHLKDLVIFSGMLGEYDKDGKYKIDEKTKKELTTCEKSIKETTEKEIKCVAYVGSFNFDFVIKIEKSSEREKTAKLYLIEKLKSFTGEIDRTEITYISAYTDSDDMYFSEKLNKVFHLHLEEKDAKDYDREKNAEFLKKKKLDLNQLKKILSSQGEELSKIYLQKMLKFLEKCGDKGDFILRKYKKILERDKSKLIKGEAGYYFKLKSILDEMIFSSKVPFSPNQQQAMDKLRKQFLDFEVPMRKVSEPAPPKPEKKKPVIIIADDSNKKKGGGGDDKKKDKGQDKDQGQNGKKGGGDKNPKKPEATKDPKPQKPEQKPKPEKKPEKGNQFKGIENLVNDYLVYDEMHSFLNENESEKTETIRNINQIKNEQKPQKPQEPEFTF